MDVQTQIYEQLRKEAKLAQEKQDEAVDDALAGLLISGVEIEDIVVLHYVATGAVGIAVKGVERYRFAGPLS